VHVSERLARQRTVRCPACGGASLYAPQNRFRPFCCERCKTQDLGAWASERFRVDAQAADDDDQAPAALPDDGA
jgi:endogenous inhibitor of DNA gyrase (YacG/DUF329 family)